MLDRPLRVVRQYLGLKRPAAPAYPEQFGPDMDLARFEGAPRLYLIASTPRSGSHFLGHALLRSGHFGVPLEYLNPGNQPFWRARFGASDTPELLRALVACRTSSSGWFGLKAHWTQFEPYADRAVFAPFGGIGRALFIVRRDRLGQAISYVRAAQSGQFISGAARRGAERYDYARLVARARVLREQNAAWTAYFATQFDKPAMPLVYEDILADQKAAFAAIGDFLDPDCPVPPAPSERTLRQSDDLSSEWRAAFLAEIRREDRWILEPQLP